MLLLLYSVHLLLYPAVSYFFATFTMIVYIRNLCELTKIPVKSQSLEKKPKGGSPDFTVVNFEVRRCRDFNGVYPLANPVLIKVFIQNGAF